MHDELIINNTGDANPDTNAATAATATASPIPGLPRQVEAEAAAQGAAPRRSKEPLSSGLDPDFRLGTIDILSRYPGRPSNPNRPRSNVARLSREIREFVNVALREGMDYREIVLRLESLAGKDHDITPSILSRWFKTGYQEWLRRTTRLEDTIAQSDAALTRLARLRKETGADLPDLLGAFLAGLMQKTLEDFDPAALKDLLAEKPAEIFRLIACLNDHIAVRSRQQQADIARVRCQIQVAEKDKAATKAPVPAINLYDAEILRQAYGSPLEKLMKAYGLVLPGKKPEQRPTGPETRESTPDQAQSFPLNST
jgi:hypothetical protein